MLKMEGPVILNSLMVIAFLVGIVLIIFLSTVRRDLTRYEELDKEAQVQMNEELSSWQLVVADVFRAPTNSTFLCVLIGDGVQILGMVVVTILFAALGFMSPASRGTLITGMLFFYLFLGILAGYVAVRLWKTIRCGNHSGWMSVSWRTACFFPGISFLILATLNFLLWGSHNTGAIPFFLFVVLILLWPAMLIIGRILLGIGVGFANQFVPVYLSEMAPAHLRGMLNIGFQLMTTVGILATNLINYGTSKMKNGEGWRVSLGLAVVPAAIITIGLLFLPDTPNSLIERGHAEKAQEMLRKVRGTDDIHEEFNDLRVASEESKAVKHPWRNILQRKYRPSLTMAILIPFFQQVTGINVIMFYAPVLFKTIGFGSDASLMSAVITGLVNVFATLVSIFTVDKLGRRKLFLEGGVQMLISQITIGTLIAIKFGTSGEAHLSKSYAGLMVVCICVYVAGFAWSWGPLGWLVPSEIFPLEIRSAGQSINVSVNMLFTFIIAQAFLAMLCHLKFGLFYFFGGWVVIMTVFIALFLPETKNVPIEDMIKVWRSHWFWGRFIQESDLHASAEMYDVKKPSQIV